MKEKYSHRERIQMLVEGNIPEDRFAASIWRHFYHREANLDGFVSAMLDYQNEYDWDFMKINPRASFHVQDWGNSLEWSKNEFEKHKKLTFAIDEVEDWEKLERLSPSASVLDEHLQAIKRIRQGVGDDLPLFMTIFTPISIARYLVGTNDKLIDHIKADPDKVLVGLEIITQTYEKYVEEIINAGADGLFFATTHWASSDTLTWQEYEKFGKPYDLRILDSVKNGLNILHVCGGNNYLGELIDYPAQLVNWDSSDPTNLPIDKGLEILGENVAIGGIDHMGWLKHSQPEEIANEIGRLRNQMVGKRLIFGPGCTIGPDVRSENIRAIRNNLIY